MFIDQYYHQSDDKIAFSRQQASDFAKRVANDFNPIHDTDAKRFCVPGDLLFAVTLQRQGLSQHMHFTFADMVTDGIELSFQQTSDNHLSINNDDGKAFFELEHSGEHSDNSALIEQLTRSYVEFSGQTFPHILVPLMRDAEVMINPARPLVMYQSMTIDLQRLDIDSIELQAAPSQIESSGKRGSVKLNFNLLHQGEIIGRGEKQMVLSGLREYDDTQMQGVVDQYAQWKSAANN